jgi:hypothetical protein
MRWLFGCEVIVLLLLLIEGVLQVFGSSCPEFRIPANYDKKVHPARPTNIHLGLVLQQVQIIDDQTLSYKIDVSPVWSK